VGLGNGPPASAVVVHWPDGSRERFPAPPPGRYTTLFQSSAPAVEKEAPEAPDDDQTEPASRTPDGDASPDAPLTRQTETGG
jgi:hypothetical protein